MRVPRAYIAAAIIGVVGACIAYGIHAGAVHTLYWDARFLYERAMLRHAPDGETAYRFGTEYMDASDHQSLQRAEYFFEEAVRIDPIYPGVHYQLARIAFIHNQLVNARVLADAEIRMNPDFEKSYYARALAYGFSGQYDAAGDDFLTFLKLNRDTKLNWAPINDYAWVMLKGGHVDRALEKLKEGIAQFPDNPWLMNEYASALYESGSYDEAAIWAQRAQARVETLTPDEFARAYPGNGYSEVPHGIAAFKEAVAANLQQIEKARSAQ